MDPQSEDASGVQKAGVLVDKIREERVKWPYGSGVGTTTAGLV